MNKSEKVAVLSTIILVGFAIGVIYCYITYSYLQLSWPFASFLYPPQAAFCDFFWSFPYIKDLNPYRTTTLCVVYFPLAYFFLYPFTLIKSLLLSYLIYVSGFIYYIIHMNVKNFFCKDLTMIQNFQNIFIITIISYPVLYNFDKGNLDMILFIILGFFVYAFKAEKYLLAAVLLAVENAIKPFPVFFLLLFLIKKRYKEFFLSIILTALMIIGGFMLLKGNFFTEITYLIKNLFMFKITYAFSIGNDYGMAFASSLFMPLKLIFCLFTAKPLISPGDLTRIYDSFCNIITLATLFFVWKEKTYWKQLTLLICNFLLLPYITYDYKLIFLFLPLWLFVNEEKKTKMDLWYTILFGLLFIPKHIVIPHLIVSKTATPWFSLSIIVNPIIMLVLSAIIIFEQFYNKKELEKTNIL